MLITITAISIWENDPNGGFRPSQYESSCSCTFQFLRMVTIGLIESGPKFDWIRDEQMYSRFLNWEKRYKMIFASALSTTRESAKCEYLKYWLEEGPSLVERWENTCKLEYEPLEPEPSGHKLETD